MRPPASVASLYLDIAGSPLFAARSMMRRRWVKKRPLVVTNRASARSRVMTSKGALEFTDCAHLDLLQREAKRRRCQFQRSLLARLTRVYKQRHPRHPGNSILQQLQPLGSNLQRNFSSETGDVAVRERETTNQTAAK